MSKIGKQPITLNGVTFSQTDEAWVAKGTRGTLQIERHPLVTVTEADGKLTVTVKDENVQEQRALWGLYRSLIANMVTGVTTGFKQDLELNGVGFRVEVKGNALALALGFSHPVNFPLPEGVKATVTKNVISLEGNDKRVLGQTAAQLRALKKPEPYKGKGIKYADEHVRRKAGKQVKSA